MDNVQTISSYYKALPSLEQKYTTPGKVFYSAYKVASENNTVTIKKTGEANILGLCPSEYQFRLHQTRSAEQLAEFKKLVDEISVTTNAKEDPKWHDFVVILEAKEAVTDKELVAAILNQTDASVKKLMEYLLVTADRSVLLEELINNNTDQDPYSFSDKEVRTIFRKLFLQRYETPLLQVAHQKLIDQSQEYKKTILHQKLTGPLLSHLNKAAQLHASIDFEKPGKYVREISAFNGEMIVINDLFIRLARTNQVQSQMLSRHNFESSAQREYKDLYSKIENLNKEHLEKLDALQIQYLETLSEEDLLASINK